MFGTVLGVAVTWKLAKIWMRFPRQYDRGLRNCFPMSVRKNMIHWHLSNTTILCKVGKITRSALHDCKKKIRVYIDCNEPLCIQRNDVSLF